MSQDNFAAVRERVDPVALVEGLTKAKVKSRSPGDVRLAPCPFCESKTGFSVNPQTKTYCCHHAGCGEQGDVFTFVMHVRGFSSNWEVLKFLAERVGYELPRARPLEDDHLAAILKLAQDVKRAAVDCYAGRLWACRDEEFTYTRDGQEHSASVLGYQADTRGHSEDVLKRMRVGWTDGKLLSHLKEHYREHPDRKLAFAAMMASGLVKKTDRGFHDLFRPGGYVYPVFDGKRIVTFTAKYPDDGVSNYQVPRTVEINGREILTWGSPFFFLNHDALDGRFVLNLWHLDGQGTQVEVVADEKCLTRVLYAQLDRYAELNRAQAEMQNKWLEIIRSRRVMGAETAVKWVWAAMNPKSYSATQTLDEALVGRFAMFVYPPEVLSMDEADRARVACHMNGDQTSIRHFSERRLRPLARVRHVDQSQALRRLLRQSGCVTPPGR